MNYRQVMAIKQANKKRILKLCNVTEQSGIYVFTRYEDGFKYAYVGQAKHLLDRLASHLSGYQHIDLSIKKHKLYSIENPTGWNVEEIFYCNESQLDSLEQHYIKLYANKGYQLRNKTAGSQGEGKVAIDEFKPARGYYDGLKQGELNTKKLINKWFKYLNYSAKNEDSKLCQRFLKQFEEFLEVE